MGVVPMLVLPWMVSVWLTSARRFEIWQRL
jgi:hypothetical protein